MLTLIVAALIAVQASAGGPSEARLIADTIAALRPHLPEPGAARFRRVYLLSFPAAGSGGRTALCGQVDMDDPRAEAGWIVFAGSEVDGEMLLLIGNEGIGSAAAFCRLQDAEWRRERDLSPEFEAALGR